MSTDHFFVFACQKCMGQIKVPAQRVRRSGFMPPTHCGCKPRPISYEGWRLKARTMLNDVWARDEGVCQLCHEPIDRNISPTLMDGVTVDHRIPLTKGGSNEIENLQLAHRRCNMAKGVTLLEPSRASA